MKKIILFIFIFAFIMNMYSKDIDLKLSVIAYDGKNINCKLVKDDLVLKVNGVPVNIDNMILQKRNASKEDKRNFVLDFSISDISEQIYLPLEYFVNEVLKADDFVILKTPIKIYPLQISGSRSDLINKIKTLLKKDVLKYKSNRKNYLAPLLRGGGGGSPEAIINFLNKYKRDWERYRDMFILPNYKNIATISAILNTKVGEKYYLRFQERELMPFMTNFNKIKNSIRNTISSYMGNNQSYASTISSNLSTLEKSLLVYEKIKINFIKNIILGVNINYNVMLFKSSRLNMKIGEVYSPDYEKYLKELAIETGGRFIVSTDLTTSLKEILNNESCYFNLVFKVSDKEEDKEIEILSKNKDLKLFYRNKFFKEDIKIIKKILNQPVIKIDKYSYKNHRLNFRIKDFVIKDKKGIFFVEIKIINKMGNIVFKTSKTLTALKKDVSISLPMPKNLKGYMNVKIFVRDNFTGREYEISEYEKF